MMFAAKLMVAQEQRLEEQKKLEEARMQDVFLLLENLFKREEATVQQVLGLLYDIGSLHLINDKVHWPVFKKPLRGVAKLSKPVFGFIAIRWFQSNCPKLTADWLYTVVTFQPEDNQEQATEVATQVLSDASKSTSTKHNIFESVHLNSKQNTASRLTSQVIGQILNRALQEHQIEIQSNPSAYNPPTGNLQLPPQHEAHALFKGEVVDSLCLEPASLEEHSVNQKRFTDTGLSSTGLSSTGLSRYSNPEQANPVKAELPRSQVSLQELQQLQRQMRRMVGVSIAAIVLSGLLGMWLGYNVRMETWKDVFESLNLVSHQDF